MIRKPSSVVEGQFDYKAVGTGFFVSKYGILMTAKHVFEDEIEEDRGKKKLALDFADGKGLIALVIMGGHAIPCPIKDIELHPTADIAISTIVPPDPDSIPIKFGISLCVLASSPAKIGDKLVAYGFQRTEVSQDEVDNDTINIEMNPKYYDGYVKDYHKDGLRMIKWPVYEHTVPLASGISGCPLIEYKSQLVVAVSCSGWSTPQEDIPDSTATDVRLAFALPIPARLRDTVKGSTLEELLRLEGQIR